MKCPHCNREIEGMTQAEFFNALTALHGGTPEPLVETIAVLSYEVGRMMESAMFAKWAEAKGNDEAVGYRACVKTELMDAIAQCILVAESLGVDFKEMKELGIEKAMERFTGKDTKLDKPFMFSHFVKPPSELPYADGLMAEGYVAMAEENKEIAERFFPLAHDPSPEGLPDAPGSTGER